MIVDEDGAGEVQDDVLEAEGQLAAVLLADVHRVRQDAVLAAEFHGVERGIGTAEELGAGAALLGVGGVSHRDRVGVRVALIAEALQACRELAQQWVGFCGRAVRQEDAELVAAVAPDNGGMLEGLAETAGHAAQSSVAGVVAVEVVDALEVVDVDHDADGLGLRVAVEIGVHGGIKALAVVEAGQDIGVGQLAQVLAAVLQCDEHMRQEGQDEDEQ